MEFAIGKSLLLTFALPTLVKICEKFGPIDMSNPDSVKSSADMRSYKRIYSKFRRLGYYVNEAEENYKILLYDELKAADIYDFSEFDEENVEVTTTGEEKNEEVTKEEEKKEGKVPTLLDKMEE